MLAEAVGNNISVVSGKCGGDFHLWVLKVKTDLRGSELIGVITKTSVETEVNEKVLSLIIRTLEEKPLQAVQDCELAKDVWEKLQERYGENRN